MATATLQTIVLHEDVSAGLSTRVDRAAGIIRGVRVLGPKSKNNRVYSEPAVRESCSLYEGIHVNYDHPRDSRERSMRDRAGWLRGVHVSNGGLSGDLCLFTSDSRAAKVLEAAERHPGAFGLSHNVRAETRQENGVLIVERITRVESVDIVSDPATTSSLFESRRWSIDAMSSSEFAARLLENDGESFAPRLDPVDQIATADDNAKADAELRKLQREVLDLVQNAMSVDGLLRDLQRLVNDKGLPVLDPSELVPAAESIDAAEFASCLTEGRSGGSRSAGRSSAASFAEALLG